MNLNAALALLAATSLSALVAPTCLWATLADVDEADDICPPTADPCIIAETVEVGSDTTLDFGTRTLEIAPGGQLKTDQHDVTVRCGRFVANTRGAVAIDAREQGRSRSGILEVGALGTCSDNSVGRCLDDSECLVGTCTHACTNDEERNCETDADCDLGPCLSNRRCARRTNVFCNTNVDCGFLGPCDTGVSTCSENREIFCVTDPGCDLGVCDLGVGDMTINGKVRGGGQFPGAVLLRATGDIEVQRSINVSGAKPLGHGGDLLIESGAGSVSVDAPIRATGAAASIGGDVMIVAGRNIDIRSKIDAYGGSGRGVVELDAGERVTVSESINLNATLGESPGGDLIVSAGGDVEFVGNAAVSAHGHAEGNSYCLDGGDVIVVAANDLLMDEGVSIQSIGPGPDCGGGTLEFRAGGRAVIGGHCESRGKGLNSPGGEMRVEAAGEVEFSETARIDVTGRGGGGGSCELSSGGDLTLDGSIDTRSTNESVGGRLTVTAGGDASIGGRVTVGGTLSLPAVRGEVSVDACRLILRPNAIVQNLGDSGATTLIGRDAMTIEAGALVLADLETGTNTLSYADSAPLPAVRGTVVPEPNIAVDVGLSRCTICGNSILESDEACDDGDTQDGDGCDSNCAVTACGNGAVSAGEGCDDGNPFGGDGCDGTCQLEPGFVCAGVPSICSTCQAVPESSCRLATSGQSSVQIRDDLFDLSDLFRWRWRGLQSSLPALGDPSVASDPVLDYRFCIYDGSARPQPLLDLSLPTGEEDGRWTATRTGFRYKDKLKSAGGTQQVKLKVRSDLSGQVDVKASGVNVETPGLPVTEPLVVQFLVSDGTTVGCWQASYASISRNDDDEVRATGP